MGVRLRIAFVLVLAGFTIRLATLGVPGSPDVPVFRTWAYHAGASGPWSVYGSSDTLANKYQLSYDGVTAAVDYPPVAIYELAVSGALSRAWSGQDPSRATLNVAVKLLILVAMVGLSALIFHAVGRRLGPVSGAAAAVACWINPAVILHGAVLGYLDPLFALPAVASLVAASEGFGWAAGGLLVVACLTKPQGVLVAPAVALALWHRSGGTTAEMRRAVAGGGALAAVAVAPFLMAGTFANMCAGVADIFTEGVLSGNAANLWWIASWAADVVHDGASAIAAPVRVLSVPMFLARIGAPADVGAALGVTLASWGMVGAVVGWAVWRSRRAERFTQFAAVAAFTVHAFFMFAIQVHENHLFLALPLLTIVAARERSYRPLLVGVSTMVVLNLGFFYGLGRAGGDALPRMAVGLDATVLLAVANCGALLWHARLLARLAEVRPATLDLLRRQTPRAAI